MPALMRVPKGEKASFGLLVVTVGWVVTSLHGYLNATWVTRFHPEPGASWFLDPRFLVGVLLYYGGLAFNLHADAAQFEIYRPFVKRAWRVERPDLFPEILGKAFQLAESGRPGPVLVSVPMDIFSKEVDPKLFARLRPHTQNIAKPAIDRAAAETPFGTIGQYVGGNIPGKPQRYLLNAGGRPKLHKEIARVKATDWAAFSCRAP